MAMLLEITDSFHEKKEGGYLRALKPADVPA